MSSIRKYKNTKGERRYAVRYRTPTHEQREKRGFLTLRTAEAFQVEVDSALLKGNYIDPKQGKIRVSDWADFWLSSRADIEEGTLDGYRGNVRKNILPKWGKRNLDSIRHSEIQAWVAELSKTLSASQTRTVFYNLSQMFKYAMKDKRLTTNPCEEVNLPKSPKHKKKYLSHEQLWSLADDCRGQADVVLCLGYLGVRFNELAGIRVENVDFKTRRIEIVEQLDVKKKRAKQTRETKTNEERRIAFPEFLASYLEKRCAGKAPDEFVFSAPKGGPLRLENFRRDFYAPALEKVTSRDKTFPQVTVHNLRNTAASLAVQSGANVKALQRMLGHASAAMTLDTYAELFDDDLDTVVIALNTAVFSSVVGKKWANLEFPVEESIP